MLKVALIDLGTNSLRIEVYEIDPSSPLSPKKAHREVYMPRIGDQLYSEKSLNPESKSQIIQILSQVKTKLDIMHLDEIKAVATSALRESDEGLIFIEQIKKETGISFEIISGNKEAELTALGILTFDNKIENDKNTLLVDIGGGSTELSICRNKEILNLASLNLGAVRAHNSLLKNQPCNQEQINELISEIQNSLSSLTFGTVRTFFDMPQFSLSESISLNSISEFVLQIKTLSIQEISQIEGISSKRAEVILGGAIILEETLKYFQIKHLQASLFSLRHGLLAKTLQTNNFL